MRNRVTMPRWPAYVMGGIAAACAVPAMTTSAPKTAAGERYEALGNDPAWRVVVHNGRMDLIRKGAKTVSVDRPAPSASFNGRRYESRRLTVDVSYTNCTDDLTGHGYQHEVRVTAGGKTYRGCGGARRSDWDI